MYTCWLYWQLIESRRSDTFIMVTNRLVLTLYVFTVIIEWTFSTMKHVKTNLHNKIKNDFFFWLYDTFHQTRTQWENRYRIYVHEFYVSKPPQDNFKLDENYIYCYLWIHYGDNCNCGLRSFKFLQFFILAFYLLHPWYQPLHSHAMEEHMNHFYPYVR